MTQAQPTEPYVACLDYLYTNAMLSVRIYCYYVFFPEWLQQMTVKKLVVVIKDVDTKEVFERWQFDVECDKTVLSDG